MNKNQRYAALGLTAGLVGGAAIGAVVGVPALTSAAGSDPTAFVTQEGTDDTTPHETTPDAGGADETPSADERPDTARIRDELQELVDNGTITSEQADAVAEHLVANRPDGPGFGGHHPRGGHRGFDGEVVAGIIGISVDELRDALQAGSTIAEVAEANGVDPQTVIDALVDEASDHLEVAVENGRLTEDEAANRLAEITERITERVNEGRPVRD